MGRPIVLCIVFVVVSFGAGCGEDKIERDVGTDADTSVVDAGSDAGLNDATGSDASDTTDATSDGSTTFACDNYGPIQDLGSAGPFLDEASGIAKSRQNNDLFWSFNDDGEDDVIVFAITGDASRVARVRVRGVATRDVEDIAIGPGPEVGSDYLYVGDIGDNQKVRSSIRVARFLEPARSELAQDIDLREADADVFDFTYGDGNAHNAEAMVVDPESGDLYIVTKVSSGDTDTLVFRAEAPLDDATPLVKLNVPPSPGLSGTVTGADFSSDRKAVALVFQIGGVRYWKRSQAAAFEDFFTDEGCDLMAPFAQHEAIALSENGDDMYLIPEGSSPTLYLFTPES